MDLEEEEGTQALLKIGRALTFKIETEDATICSFISEPMYVTRKAYQILNNTLKEREQEEITEETLVSNTEIIPVIENSKSIPVEIKPGKILNINPNLKVDELEHLATLLKWNKKAFDWEYTDMRGIP